MKRLEFPVSFGPGIRARREQQLAAIRLSHPDANLPDPDEACSQREWKRRLHVWRRKNTTNSSAASGAGEEILPDQAAPPGVPAKYWAQRKRLWGRYEEGVQMDEEAWYSATPELIAEHTARRMACGTLLDAFCGVGGNTVRFAAVCGHVIAVDNSPERIAMAKHNAELYGVAEKITFITADFFALPPLPPVDAVFLSPPWGGPAYLQHEALSLRAMDVDGVAAYEVAARLSPAVAYFLPRNIALPELAALGPVEVEQNLLNGKVKTLTCYFGPLVAGLGGHYAWEVGESCVAPWEGQPYPATVRRTDPLRCRALVNYRDYGNEAWLAWADLQLPQ